LKGMASIRRIYNGKETFARFAFLMKTKMPSVILEPLFISNEEDVKFIRDNEQYAIDILARGAVLGIENYKKHYG